MNRGSINFPWIISTAVKGKTKERREWVGEITNSRRGDADVDAPKKKKRSAGLDELFSRQHTSCEIQASNSIIKQCMKINHGGVLPSAMQVFVQILQKEEGEIEWNNDISGHI